MTNNVLDSIKQGVGAGVSAINSKTEELTEIAKLKATNVQLSAQQKQLTAALGEKLFQLHRAGTGISAEAFTENFEALDEICARIERNNALVEERKRQEAARQGIVCPACQCVNVSEAMFCKNCAQRLKESAPAQGLFCKYCGAKNDMDAAFCEGCGQKMK